MGTDEPFWLQERKKNMSDWYLDATYSECKDIIKANLSNMSQSFIAIGFYLKRVRDKELFKTDGYKDIWEFALDQYGIQRSTASRWMAMNDRFSKDGNSPILQEKYKLFGKSQLQEILYLPEEKLEEITPEMTVKEIRESRKPETCATSHISALGFPLREYPESSLIQSKGCGKSYTCDSCSQNKCDIRQEKRWCVEAPCGNPFSCTTMEVTESLKKEVGEKCQFVNHDLAYHRAGDGQPTPCCKKCETPCEYECRRSVEKRMPRTMEIAKEDLKIPGNVLENKEDIVQAPNDNSVIADEVPEKHGEQERYDITETLEENKDNLAVIRYILEKEERTLQEYIDCEKSDGPLPEMMIKHQEIIVEALKIFCKIQEGKNQEEHIQPELPPMKNNDQRKEWLRNYRDWGLWYEDEHIGAKYYRYEFENGAVLIAEEYECSNEYVKSYTSSYLHLVGGPESAKGVNGVRKWQTHEKYSRYPNNETELVEFLKEIQK